MDYSSRLKEAHNLLENTDIETIHSLASTQADIRERAFAILNVNQQPENPQYIAVALATRGHILEALACLDIAIDKNIPISTTSVRHIYQSSLEYCATVSPSERENVCYSIDQIFDRIAKYQTEIDGEFYVLQGDHKQLIGHGNEALDSYHQAIELGSADGYERTAQHYERSGDPTTALMLVDIGYQLYGKIELLVYSLRLLCQMGRIEEARKRHAELKIQDPESVSPFCFYTDIIESDTDLTVLEIFAGGANIEWQKYSEDTEKHTSEYIKIGNMMRSANEYIEREIQSCHTSEKEILTAFSGEHLHTSHKSMRMLWLIQYDTSVLLNTRYLNTHISLIEWLIEVSNNPVAVANIHRFLAHYGSIFMAHWVESQGDRLPLIHTPVMWDESIWDQFDNNEVEASIELPVNHRCVNTLITLMCQLKYLNNINLEYTTVSKDKGYHENHMRMERIHTILHRIHTILPRNYDTLDRYVHHIEERAFIINLISERYAPNIRKAYHALEKYTDETYGKYYRKYIQDIIITRKYDEMDEIAQMAKNDAMFELFFWVSYMYILDWDDIERVEAYFQKYISKSMDEEARRIFSRFAIVTTETWWFWNMMQDYKAILDEPRSLELLWKHLLELPATKREEILATISGIISARTKISYIDIVINRLTKYKSVPSHELESYIMSVIYFYLLNDTDLWELSRLLHIAADQYKSVDAMYLLIQQALKNEDYNTVQHYTHLMLVHDDSIYTLKKITSFLFDISDKIDINPYIQLALQKKFFPSKTLIFKYIHEKKYPEAQSVLLNLCHKNITSLHSHSIDKELLHIGIRHAPKKSDISPYSSPHVIKQELRLRYMKIFSNKWSTTYILQYVSYLEAILQTIPISLRSEYVIEWLSDIENSLLFSPLVETDQKAVEYIHVHLERLWKYFSQYTISDRNGNDVTRYYEAQYTGKILWILSLLQHKDQWKEEFWEKIHFFSEWEHEPYLRSWWIH